MANKHPVRGFGTGKGRAKGTTNKLTHTQNQLLAKVIAGALDEPALKLLQLSDPEVHAALLRDKRIKRALAIHGEDMKPLVERRRLKVKAQIEAPSPLDHLSDAEVVRDAMMRKGTDRKTAMHIVETMAKCTGFISLEREATKLRREAYLASLSPETKLEMAVNNYRDYYGREPKPHSKRAR